MSILHALPVYVRRFTLLAVALVTIVTTHPGAAAEDTEKGFRAALAESGKREKAYFEAFDRRFQAGLATWLAARRKANEVSPNDRESDALKDWRALYSDLEAVQRDVGAAGSAYASAAGAAAYAGLLDEVQRITTQEVVLDREILTAEPRILGRICDQEPAFRRHALAERRRVVIEALATVPGAATRLATDGLADAAKRDGKSSVAHRVAILDALGRCGDPKSLLAVLALTTSRSSALRIAAIDAALPLGMEAQPELVPLLRDSHSNVVRALLAGIRTRAADDIRWIVPVVELHAAAKGQTRADAHAALGALTGHRGPDAPETWKAWLEKHRTELAAGKLDRTPTAGETSDAPPARGTFYGFGTQSQGVVFVLDWSVPMTFPSDVVLARTRESVDWFGMDKSWEKDCPSNRMTVIREVGRFLAAMPADSRFGLTMLTDGSKEDYPNLQKDVTVGIGGLVPPTANAVRDACDRMEKRLPGWSRYHDPLSGLMIAMALAGVPPEDDADLKPPVADTVFLVAPGGKEGGRYVLPEMDVAAFARLNRFRRLVVKSVRIGYAGRSAELLMKGFADVSGGSYVRPMQAPK
ncbi:MAG: HEAT repeat domain-containing protein [Planctomycetes bacterium]|nr:HEAT repeat domain-containing protein [Planctomycetota bacterium]